MINYLFDIDGTLTPSREKIDDNFKHIFADWVLYQQSLNNKVFFVTGSDRDKTVEQVGVPLWRLVDGSYQCCGNRLYKNGKLTKVIKNPNYRGISIPFWNSLKGVGNPETFGIYGTPNCGKGEPNQAIRVGHASPVCFFENIDVFGGA